MTVRYVRKWDDDVELGERRGHRVARGARAARPTLATLAPARDRHGALAQARCADRHQVRILLRRSRARHHAAARRRAAGRRATRAVANHRGIAAMIDMTLVDLSRLQFALTALYHFLFVPLTLGLSMILAIMEATYVMTGREVWKQMTQFWGVLFGINFAMGVATGITMEFQFGTNWAYYSHYVGDIFGAPLAIEGLMAFFLESTFVGLFFFGWQRLSRHQHLVVTWLVALGSNFSALWILIANGWMQNPV